MEKRILSAALSLVLLLALMPAAFAADSNPYKDVDIGDWYYPAVEYMSGKNYMTGYSATEFAPNDTLSRAMFVTVLYRVSGEKVNSKETNFTDVAQNTWYSEAVAWAVANGITSGTSDTTFSPDAPVTREQMAAFMKRYIDNRNIDVFNGFSVNSTPQDMSKSSGWAKDAVQFMHKHGILLEEDNIIRPTDNATRLETAMAFYNFLCLTKGTDNHMLLSYNYYDESINISCTHNWAAKHYDEVGHYEHSKTHTVRYLRHDCGFEVNSDMPNAAEIWRNHTRECSRNYIYWDVEVPDDSHWVVDYPAYDLFYCTCCGVYQ